MKLKYMSAVKDAIPVTDSRGNQRVIGILHDDGNIIVMYVDAVMQTSYIERVINKFAINMLESSNFEVISDEEHEAYCKFFVDQGIMKLG